MYDANTGGVQRQCRPTRASEASRRARASPTAAGATSTSQATVVVLLVLLVLPYCCWWWWSQRSRAQTHRSAASLTQMPNPVPVPDVLG